MPRFILFLVLLGLCPAPLSAQSWRLTPENIDSAFASMAPRLAEAAFRPGFHLTPPAGCMGDPNGGIYHDGWYHIFYGLQPFAFHPGAWYWAHARSRDLLRWEHLPPRLTPAFARDLDAIGSGSTLVTEGGQRLAFYSQGQGGPMMFWRAVFTGDDLNQWQHPAPNPILTLDHPGLPPFDGFWRDPFVFTTGGRTFLIACADLFEADYVPVPIFEAQDEALTEWTYRGELFRVPKRRFRNLEVPEFRQLGDKWLFLASTDAPVDRVNYWLGEFDLATLTFTPEQQGPIDHSGHYYAQETIQDDAGDLYLMGWLPGWDREWLPTYMNAPQKNANRLWNGCFALPRKLSLVEGTLIQQPVAKLQQLRGKAFDLPGRDLPVDGPTTGIQVIEGLRGDQLELQLRFDLQAASFVGLNVLCDAEGQGGLPLIWNGEGLDVDGVKVPLPTWQPGEALELRVFVDKKFVEVFVNGGRHCVSRQLQEAHVKGDHLALTSLGGTGRLLSMQGWESRGWGE